MSITNKEVAARQKELLFPCVTTYYEEPIAFAKGEGCRLWDVEGTEYLDFFGGILTVSLGHAEPRVTEAVIDQVKKLVHVSTLYPIQEQVRAAEKLIQISPIKGKQKAFFTSSGTEADETALVLAKVFTKTTEVIALRHSYSGRTLVAMTNTAHARYRALPAQVPGTVHAHAPYCYRCPYGATYPSCGVRCAQDLEELIMTCTTGKPAAFFAEPILGVGGFIVPPKEYFQIAVGIVRQRGGLFVCDEVQTGFGRTGSMFAIDAAGVRPDVVVMAKGIASGFPISAIGASAELMARWPQGSHGGTYGGNPIGCAAALATIDVLTEAGFLDAVQARGDQLRAGLRALADAHPDLADVRGPGLMVASELLDPERRPLTARAAAVVAHCRDEGHLLLMTTGADGGTIRWMPPLVVSETEIDAALAAFAEALAATA